jgi:DNA (cytosine-5)-methyltransferase 1
MKHCLPVKVFDFFSGCGGASKGFQKAGMDVAFALDNDSDAAKTFKENFIPTRVVEDLGLKTDFSGTWFLLQDIESVPTASIQPLVDACESHPLLFAGCAPCQPFTKQNTRRRPDDRREDLLTEFTRFVEHYKPELVFVENVPGLQKLTNRHGPFAEFLVVLGRLGYVYRYEIVASQDYGVPQRRRRLVLIASLLGPIEFPAKTHGPGTPHPEYEKVRDWIGDLPPIKAGETHPFVPNHRAARLSAMNQERIGVTPEGGDRRDWPAHLQLECHLRGYAGHTDVYGRMCWDRPATGLTTRCISLSNGRFGHPEQDRAISVREAACLQTFPRDFVFHGSLSSMARQIGNAVPVLLAERFGETFVDHLRTYL